MKYAILIAPSLAPFLFALLLSASSGPLQTPATKAAREAEIGKLRNQLHDTRARLSVLEGSGHNFLPR